MKKLFFVLRVSFLVSCKKEKITLDLKPGTSINNIQNANAVVPFIDAIGGDDY